MTRFAVLALVLSTLVAGTAEAQTASSRSTAAARVALSLADQDELRTVESNAGTATTLYVCGPIAHVAGVALALRGFASGLSHVTLGFGGGGGGGSHPEDEAMFFTGAVLGVGGLALLFTGIGFDADSGRRRNVLRARYPGVDLSVAPTEGGAYAAGLVRF